MHTLNYCKNVDPKFSSVHTPKDISRITTIGFGEIEKNEEKLFFLLDNITETSYIININEDDLANDTDLLPTIKTKIGRNKKWTILAEGVPTKSPHALAAGHAAPAPPSLLITARPDGRRRIWRACQTYISIVTGASSRPLKVCSHFAPVAPSTTR